MEVLSLRKRKETETGSSFFFFLLTFVYRWYGDTGLMTEPCLQGRTWLQRCVDTNAFLSGEVEQGVEPETAWVDTMIKESASSAVACHRAGHGVLGDSFS